MVGILFTNLKSDTSAAQRFLIGYFQHLLLIGIFPLTNRRRSIGG